MIAKLFTKPGLALLVAIVTVAVYLPALNNGFVNFDDYGYLVDNPSVGPLSWQFVKWAFTTNFSALWQPLSWLSFSLDYTLWGGFAPLGFHLTNIVLHGLNAGFVFLVTASLVEAYREGRGERSAPRESRDVAGSDQGRGFVLLSALLGALLFSLHPLRVEAVAWVFERKSVLSLFFCLPAILLYLDHARDAGRSGGGLAGALRDRRYLGSLLLFALSLMSKPVASTLPLLLLIIDWHPLGLLDGPARRKGMLLEKVPYLALSAAIAIVTLLADRLAHTRPPEVALFERLLGACKAVIFYLGLMVWPAGLRPYYLYPQQISIASPAFFLPVVAIAAITAASVILARRERTPLAAWLFFLIALLPVSGILRFGSMMPADRYTYFPGLGASVLAAVSLAWLFFRALRSGSYGDVLASLVAGCLCSLFVVYGALTVKHIAVWKDSLTFWNRVIEVEPATGAAYLFRGKEYAKNGDYQDALRDMDVALALAQRKQAKNAYHEIYGYRGRALMFAGRYAEAAEDFTRAIETSAYEKRDAPLQEYYDLRADALNRLRQQGAAKPSVQP